MKFKISYDYQTNRVDLDFPESLYLDPQDFKNHIAPILIRLLKKEISEYLLEDTKNDLQLAFQDLRNQGKLFLEGEPTPIPLVYYTALRSCGSDLDSGNKNFIEKERSKTR